MANLNLSANGASISKSYQFVINAPAPTGVAATSPTYGVWALFLVSAPLANAFQQDSSKESVLKVQSTGGGELKDLIDDFSDGRIQFAFTKVKDPKSGLQKHVLICWCGEGVPERTKGYFASHQAAVAKTLHGYHVQITARSDRDLTPEGIIQKVTDASGATYSTNEPSAADMASPSVPKRPVFTPTASIGSSGFNPLANRRLLAAVSGPTDEDGWGADAPQVTRSQLENVESAYKPTTVNMKDLVSQKQEPSRFVSETPPSDRGDIVQGSYKPVGKVDLAAIRRQAAASGQVQDDRPTAVKGSYEPVGRVDLAAIKARAQQPGNSQSTPNMITPEVTSTSDAQVKTEPSSLTERSVAFQTQGRLVDIPKPKVAKHFGLSANTFTGTKAPIPGQFGFQSARSTGPAGSTPLGPTRSFQSSAGKTPAQLWAEKKAMRGGPPEPAPLTSHLSGGWKSSYSGKKWDVGTKKPGSPVAPPVQDHDEARKDETPSMSDIRAQFQVAPAPPAIDASNKPTTQVETTMAIHSQTATGPALPTPPAVPRSPTPPLEDEEEAESPLRIAMPVARGSEVPIVNAPEEQNSPPPPMPIASLSKQIPQEEPANDEPNTGPDAAREAGEATAAITFGAQAASAVQTSARAGGKRAVVLYDYEKAEDNEIELREGEYVMDLEFPDDDWWHGRTTSGETGLFPSNYVELVDNEDAYHDVRTTPQIPTISEPQVEAASSAAATPASGGPTATAQYDYEAAEDNEISFPEGAKITNVEFPDDDWWSGIYNGQHGLFPANYVSLNE